MPTATATPTTRTATPNSAIQPTIILGGVDTGAPNSVFYGGCTMTDEILQLKATSRNQATFLSALAPADQPVEVA